MSADVSDQPAASAPDALPKLDGQVWEAVLTMLSAMLDDAVTAVQLRRIDLEGFDRKLVEIEASGADAARATLPRLIERRRDLEDETNALTKHVDDFRFMVESLQRLREEVTTRERLQLESLQQIQTLEEQRAKLAADVARLHGEGDALAQGNEQITRLNEALRGENADLTRQNGTLEEKLAAAEGEIAKLKAGQGELEEVIELLSSTGGSSRSRTSTLPSPAPAAEGATKSTPAPIVDGLPEAAPAPAAAGPEPAPLAPEYAPPAVDPTLPEPLAPPDAASDAAPASFLMPPRSDAPVPLPSRDESGPYIPSPMPPPRPLASGTVDAAPSLVDAPPEDVPTPSAPSAEGSSEEPAAAGASWADMASGEGDVPAPPEDYAADADDFDVEVAGGEMPTPDEAAAPSAAPNGASGPVVLDDATHLRALPAMESYQPDGAQELKLMGILLHQSYRVSEIVRLSQLDRSVVEERLRAFADRGLLEILPD